MAFKAKLSKLLKKASLARAQGAEVLSYDQKGNVITLMLGDAFEYPDTVKINDCTVEVDEAGYVRALGDFRYSGCRVWNRGASLFLEFSMTRPITAKDMK